MSDDYTARMIQWIMEQSAAGQPQQIPEYDIDPEDFVQDRSRRENFYQDTLSDQADMSVASMAGPGAFAPGAFDSTYSYTPVEQPGTQALRAYAARANTPEGIIAAGILAGSTAAAEIAKLQQAYTEAEANGTLEGSVLAQIPMAPPRDYDGAVLPDWESLSFRMGDVEEAYFTESQGGTSGALFDPYTGEFVGGGNRQTLLDENGQPVLADVETQMSEAAQWFADQGLSNPNDQFTPYDFLGPDYQGSPEMTDAITQQLISVFQSDPSAMMPQDPGKAGMYGAPPVYDKGVHDPSKVDTRTTPDAGVGGGGLNDMDSRQRALGDVAQHTGQWLRDLITSSGGMAGPQTAVSGTDPYGFPTTSSTGGTGWEGMIESIPADVAQAGVTDLSVSQNALARLIDNWGGGLAGGWHNVMGGNDQPDTPDLGEAGPTHEDYVRYRASVDSFDTPLTYDAWLAQQSHPEQGEGITPGTPLPPLNTNDLAAVFGTGNAGTGTGGGGAGGMGAPRTAADLYDSPPSPPGYTRPFDQYLQGQQPQYNVPGQAPADPMASGPPMPQPPTQPTVQQMIQILMGGHTPAAPYQGPGDPPPTTYTTEQLLSIMGQQPRSQPTADQRLSIMGQQAQQPTTDQTLSIMGQQPRQPTSDQVLSIMGQQPRTGNRGDQQVRIGGDRQMRGGTKGQSSSSKPKPRDTAERRQWFSDAQAAIDARSRDRRENYGYDYGRAAAAAYLMAQQGIRPLDVQQAARRAASGPYGV